MTSVGAFNDMMEQFLDELVQTFPEEKAIKKYKASFELVRKANPRKCVESFMATITPFAHKITSKDESILDDEFNLIRDINIKAHWTPELSQNTKDAVWQYLQTLYMLGTTISSIPADTLSMIESVASQCADKIQSGDGQIDEKALMNSVSGLLGNLGGMFGNQPGKN